MTKDKLVLDKICVTFGGLRAVSDVSEEFSRSEIVGLIGPNGAGKTTLVNAMTGFQKVTSGSAAVGSQRLLGLKPAATARLGVTRTFQAGRLFKDMSVYENIAVGGYSAKLDHLTIRRAVWDLLHWLGLEKQADHKAETLQYTDERRVGIARALILKPKFVFLDEPAAGMSDMECNDIIGHIAEIPSRFGCGVVLIEHNMRIVRSVCDRLHIMDAGKTLATGAPKDVLAQEQVIKAYLGGIA